MTSALHAWNTLLKIGDGGGPEAFTTIAEVTNITGPGLALDTIDVTNMSSPNAWREFIAGLLDAGEVSFDINYLPGNATHNAGTGLVRDLKNRTKRNFQLVMPSSPTTTWNFSAYVTGFEPDFPVEDKIAASVTLKLTGEPTLV